MTDEQDKFIHELKNVRTVQVLMIHNAKKDIKRLNEIASTIKRLEEKVDKFFVKNGG